MSFPWYEPTIPADYRATFPEKLRDMHRRDVRERASLLATLGYARDAAVARCRQNIVWEYDGTRRSSAVLDEVERIVDEVYHRR